MTPVGGIVYPLKNELLGPRKIPSTFSDFKGDNSEIDEREDRDKYINGLITFYGEGVLLTAVSTFGLVGNLMSIIVLTRSINSRGGQNTQGRLGSRYVETHQ